MTMSTGPSWPEEVGEISYTSDEMMTVSAARALRDGMTCFVGIDRVDFVTSVGYGSGPGDRERLGLTGAGPRKIITDLGVLEPEPRTLEFILTGLYPGIPASAAKERTGWDLAIAAAPETIAAPTARSSVPCARSGRP